MKRFFLTLSVVAAMFTGCAVQTPSYTELSTRILEPKQRMLLTPVIADLQVSDVKISYAETIDLSGVSEITPALVRDISELKKIALSRAAQVHKADVMVAPTINIETKGKILEIIVTGYPACYTKIRNITSEDVELLKVAYGNTEVVSVNNLE